MFAAAVVFLLFFHSTHQAEPLADRLRPFLDEVDGHLSANFRNVSDAVLIIGAPGTGKTSLAMLMAEDVSLRLQRSPAGVLLADDGRKIGRDTYLPNFMRDDVLGTILVDCPAPLEPEEAFVAAEYAVLKITSMLPKMKILVVENFFSFIEGGDKDGQHRLRAIANNFEPLAAVVPTKGDNNSVFTGWAEFGAPIVGFPRPFRPGSPIETLQATTSSVRNAIVGAVWSSPSPSFTPRAHCYANEMIKQVLNESKIEFGSLLDRFYEHKLALIENSTDHMNASKSLKNQLIKMNAYNYTALLTTLKKSNISSSRLVFLSAQLDWARGMNLKFNFNISENLQILINNATKITQFYDLLNEVSSALGNYKYIAERDHLAKVLEDQPFDNILESTSALLDLQSRPQLLGLHLTDWMRSDFDNILREKLKFDDWSNKGVVLAAPIILLSEASKYFDNWNDSAIVLMASETVYLDQDVLIENGKNLAIIAPEVRVVKENITLVLSGEKGFGYNNASDEGDGRAGGPGGPAGSLLIICSRIEGAENLLVSSIGGSGGDGQQGAPASQGAFKPAEKTFEFLESAHNSTSSNKTSGAIKVTYKDGREDAIKAGNGGAGGQGGYPGAILIYKKDTEAKGIRSKISMGAPGRHGEGGKGALEDAKFTFKIAECHEQCVQVAAGQSHENLPALEKGVAGASFIDYQNATLPAQLTLRRFMYLYVGTILAKDLSSKAEKDVVALVERLPEIIRLRGGDTEGGLHQMQAEWAVMEREQEEMRRALGRHLPLMHHILLAYADHAPGGKSLSELIRSSRAN